MEQRERMESIKLQFPPRELQIYRELAAERGESVASVIRKLLSGRAAKYLGEVRYVDPEQGQEYLKAIHDLNTELENIRVQFIRVGNNLNQSVVIGYDENIFTNVKSIEEVRDMVEDNMKKFSHLKNEVVSSCHIQG